MKLKSDAGEFLAIDFVDRDDISHYGRMKDFDDALDWYKFAYIVA
jgi:hypothetical protein